MRPTLELPVRQPAPAGSPGTATIALSGLAVDPAFLARVIGYYIQYPEHRPTIGTAQGYQRLQAALRIDPFRPIRRPDHLTRAS
ncbi:MAG TPA: hypothetical protein VFM54_11535 [Micromonosporaceae bacterium]|nr:hypothetical protein [Micromonosporaceae bacterium]